MIAETYWAALPWQVKAKLAGGIGAAAVLGAAVPPLGMAAGGWTAYRSAQASWAHWCWLRDWLPHYREFVEPLHFALAPVLKLDPLVVTPTAYIDAPIGLLDAEGGVVITLPNGPLPSTKTRAEVVQTVSEKLGLSDFQASWRLKGKDRFVRFTHIARVPHLVAYADEEIRAKVERSRPGRPFLAQRAGASGPVDMRVDFDAETPHALFSAGTGGGKSENAKVIAAQEMHHGAGVIILDRKKRSQKWAKGLPGVIYCRKFPQMHRALVALGKELERRSDLADELPDDAVLNLPRIIVICEELNATMRGLADYWREIRTKDDPKTSPAITAYRDALFMGRAEKVNVIAIAQMGTAAALGGGEARENYGLRGLARFTEPARKMLIPNSRQASSLHRGRWLVAQGSDAVLCQTLWMTDDEARAWATSGVTPTLNLPGVSDLLAANVAGVAASRDASLPGETVRDGRGPRAGRPALEVLDGGAAGATTAVLEDAPARTLVTLTEVSTDKGDGRIGLTYDQLRVARDGRDPEFPPHADAKRRNAWLYDLEALRWWVDNRDSRTEGSAGA